MGVNDRVQLAEAERIMQERLHRAHAAGRDYYRSREYIYRTGLQYWSDTVIYPQTIIQTGTVIG